MKKYEVLYNNNIVGYANIQICGLFAEIACRCTFKTEGLYRIKLSYNDTELDLGICVPIGDSFTVHKKIPCKCLGTGEPVFSVINTQEQQMNYVTITGDTSFPYLSKIMSCKFSTSDNKPVLVINEINV